MRLDAVGEDLEALGAAEVGGGFAADEGQQPAHPLVPEVLEVGGAGVEGVLDLVEVERRADADARVEPAAGQDVHGGQILGEAERVLPGERGDGGAQLDAGGALGGGGQNGYGGGDAVLQMAVAYPGAVEAEPLAQLDDSQRRFVSRARVVPVEQSDGQETQLA